jgi:hypothetical protein
LELLIKKYPVFLDGFRNAMINAFSNLGDNYAFPAVRKKPPADTSPMEAFRQGYNIAIAVFILEMGGNDREENWRTWCGKRWRGRC